VKSKKKSAVNFLLDDVKLRLKAVKYTHTNKIKMANIIFWKLHNTISGNWLNLKTKCNYLFIENVLLFQKQLRTTATASTAV